MSEAISRAQRRKELETAAVIVLGLVLAYWFKRAGFLWITALVIALAALAVPFFGRALHRAWMKLAGAMGAISGSVLLTVVFFVVLVPLSFFARIFGKLSIKLKPGGETYFKTRDHVYRKEDMIHPW